MNEKVELFYIHLFNRHFIPLNKMTPRMPQELKYEVFRDIKKINLGLVDNIYE